MAKLAEVRAVRDVRGGQHYVEINGKIASREYRQPKSAWTGALVAAANLCATTDEAVLVQGPQGAFVLSPGTYPQPEER